MTTAEKLVKVLTEKKMTCATAESCTGGGVGYTITGVSGASAVFWGGVISYDNSVKRDVLGVPDAVLATKGAVSPECATARPSARRRLNMRCNSCSRRWPRIAENAFPALCDLVKYILLYNQ